MSAPKPDTLVTDLQLHWEAAHAVSTKDYVKLSRLLRDHPGEEIKIGKLMERAVFTGDVKVVDMIVTADRGMEGHRERLRHAAKAACETGNEEVIQSLICAGAPIEGIMVTDYVEELLHEYRDQRPTIDPTHNPETLKERLLKPSQQHFTPLDNPKTWHRFNEIGAILLAQGKPLTKDELFGYNPQGVRFIETAIASRALPEVMQHLKAQGDPLTLQEIRDENLLDLVCRKGGAPLLFVQEMLVGEGGVQALDTLRREVPEEAMFQVNNLSQLRLALQSLPQTGKGMGR